MPREAVVSALRSAGVELPEHGPFVIRVVGPAVIVERVATIKQRTPHAARAWQYKVNSRPRFGALPNRYLSTSEAAERLGVSGETVRRWCANGWVPVRRVGKRWQIPVEAVTEGDFFMAKLRELTGGRVRGTEYDGEPDSDSDP